MTACYLIFFLQSPSFNNEIFFRYQCQRREVELALIYRISVQMSGVFSATSFLSNNFFLSSFILKECVPLQPPLRFLLRRKPLLRQPPCPGPLHHPTSVLHVLSAITGVGVVIFSSPVSVRFRFRFAFTPSIFQSQNPRHEVSRLPAAVGSRQSPPPQHQDAFSLTAHESH